MTCGRVFLVAGVLIVVFIGLPLAALGQSPNPSDISLAQLARELNEQRASKSLAPVRVLTNDDLPAQPVQNKSEHKQSGSEGEKADNRPKGPSSGAEPVDFHPAEAESVSDIKKPEVILGYGIVVLDVVISANGEVENVQVRRDPGSLTDVAVGAVRSWKIRPAQENGKAVASRLTIAVNFNAGTTLMSGRGEADLPLPALIHQDDDSRIQSAYQPPEVTRAPLPAFPFGALGDGTVIVQATVNEEGEAQNPTVLRDATPFTSAALHAAADWRFIPATLNGTPVKSQVVLAFVFTAARSTNNF